MRWTPVGIAATAVGLALVGGAVGVALNEDASGEDGGPGVHIALFTPPDPEPMKGPVMDVGEVVDGYEHHPFAQPAAYEEVTAWLPEDEPYASLPEPPRRNAMFNEAEPPPPPPPEETPPEPQGRWSFGFERRLPDFAAERRERRARREAYMAAEGSDDPRAWASAPEPAPAPEHLDPAATGSADMFY